MGEFWFIIKFAGGVIPGETYWPQPGKKGDIRLTGGRLAIRDFTEGKRKAEFDISTLRHISYEDAGTKSNIAALAAFGVFGLGARRAWTLITIGFEKNDALFLTREPVFRVRDLLQQAAAEDPALKELIREGAPPAVAASTPEPANEPSKLVGLDELERLCQLHTDGHLTDDEFRAMKGKIIGVDGALPD